MTKKLCRSIPRNPEMKANLRSRKCDIFQPKNCRAIWKLLWTFGHKRQSDNLNHVDITYLIFFLVPLFLFLNSAVIKIMVKTFKTTTLPKTYLCRVLSVEYIVMSLGMELISSFNSVKPLSTLTGISNGILSKIRR